MALDVAQQYVLRRANRQQHDGISPQTSYLILKVRFLPGSAASLSALLGQESIVKACCKPFAVPRHWAQLIIVCFAHFALQPWSFGSLKASHGAPILGNRGVGQRCTGSNALR